MIYFPGRLFITLKGFFQGVFANKVTSCYVFFPLNSFLFLLQDALTVVVEDLRLCSVKPCEDIERRFCFEVVSPTKYVVSNTWSVFSSKRLYMCVSYLGVWIIIITYKPPFVAVAEAACCRPSLRSCGRPGFRLCRPASPQPTERSQITTI